MTTSVIFVDDDLVGGLTSISSFYAPIIDHSSLYPSYLQTEMENISAPS